MPQLAFPRRSSVCGRLWTVNPDLEICVDDRFPKNLRRIWVLSSGTAPLHLERSLSASATVHSRFESTRSIGLLLRRRATRYLSSSVKMGCHLVWRDYLSRALSAPIGTSGSPDQEPPLSALLAQVTQMGSRNRVTIQVPCPSVSPAVIRPLSPSRTLRRLLSGFNVRCGRSLSLAPV